MRRKATGNRTHRDLCSIRRSNSWNASDVPPRRNGALEHSKRRTWRSTNRPPKGLPRELARELLAKATMSSDRFRTLKVIRNVQIRYFLLFHLRHVVNDLFLVSLYRIGPGPLPYPMEISSFPKTGNVFKCDNFYIIKCQFYRKYNFIGDSLANPTIFENNFEK